MLAREDPGVLSQVICGRIVTDEPPGERTYEARVLFEHLRQQRRGRFHSKNRMLAGLLGVREKCRFWESTIGIPMASGPQSPRVTMPALPEPPTQASGQKAGFCVQD